MNTYLEETKKLFEEEKRIKKSGYGKRGNHLSSRERIDVLIDDPKDFFEINLFAGFEMYPEFGTLDAAGVVTGIARVEGNEVMIISSDASQKAGAMFPQSVKKILRAQMIAFKCSLPVIYLLDSAGVFLPLQDEIFPDQDDFGKIFYNNALLSSNGIYQIAAIMGNCIAGGGYLPVLCDQLLMTEGSGLYLAGPHLVEAAIGQKTTKEELGGAKMHATISGTIDFREQDDKKALLTIRKLIRMLPEEEKSQPLSFKPPQKKQDEIFNILSPCGKKAYDVRAFLEPILDDDSFIECKKEYGKALVTGFGTIMGQKVALVASQRMPEKSGRGEIMIGGVIYAESADKAARFVMQANQMKVPLLFIQDVMGFMVGSEAEQSGIIKSGAKLVSAISCSIVPKITLIVGASYGAGNYALCGKAFDPTFIFAYPCAKISVMGAEQAAKVVVAMKKTKAEKAGKIMSDEEFEQEFLKTKENYLRQQDVRYAAARGFIDAIIHPLDTRDVLSRCLKLAQKAKLSHPIFHTGVYQV